MTATPRVDSITWTLHPDNSFETSAVYYYSGLAPVPSGTLRLNPNQYSDYLAQAGLKLVPQVLAAYDATTDPTPTAGPADVARMVHDFFWTWSLAASAAQTAEPQTGTAPAIT